VGALDGRRIVVTGASRGLGRGFALALAGAGARLVVNGTNTDLITELTTAITDAGGQVVSVVGSVADDALAEELVYTCVDAFGGVDAVVNNAGIVRDRTLMNMSPEEFDEVVAVNLRGTWSGSRHAARAMKETGGLLLQVVSNSAFVGSVGQTNYAASKAGLIGFAKSVALEVASRGITVNVVAPGLIETDMTRAMTEQAQTDWATQIPVGRPGTPDDVAAAVCFLASDEAAYITGHVLAVNGGMYM